MANFVRRHPDPSGVYLACLGERKGTLQHIRIEGRALYSTDNKEEIALLRSDVENVEEVNETTKIELVGDNE